MSESLRQQQFRLANYLRDPQQQTPPPGIEERRLAIYRDLFFNNIESLLSGNFPVIRKILGPARWRVMVRDFYARHRSQTPLFAEIGREFIRFLQQHADAQAGDPAWLPELAHYEWVELGLQIADDLLPPHDPEGDLLLGIPVISPFAWALAYTWPVHQLGPDYQPLEAPVAPTLLLVRRDARHEIRFSELSPLVYRLLEILRLGACNGTQALQQLAAESAVSDVPAFVEQGAAMLQRMRHEGTVLGTV